MGLSIHYQGGIDRIEDIPKLVEELEDIGESMGWKSQRLNADEKDPNFRGIIVNPEGDCEPLCFIFDRAGKLRGLMDLISDQVEPTEYSYYIATKTQFIAIETHIWIIGLLRYLKKHYLSDLSVSDEGGYWETENFEALKAKQAFLQDKINQLAEGLEAAETPVHHLSLDELVSRIEAIAKKQQTFPHFRPAGIGLTTKITENTENENR